MHNPTHPAAKILIVDDEISHVTFLKAILANAGYTHLTSVLDPRDAIARFQELQPDLVVLDILMPGIGGIQLLKGFRALIGEDDFLPILVVTADLTPEVRREALASGAGDFMIKPYERWDLLLRLGNLLATRAVHRDLASTTAELAGEVMRRREAEAALRQQQGNALQPSFR
jgi:putative two-component system response regulator